MPLELYHGDCFERLKNVPSESVDMVFTDPPFGQDVDYGRSEYGHRRITNDDNLAWLPKFAAESYRILKPNTHCVVFWQWRTYSILEDVMLAAGFDIKTVAIWDKNNLGLGGGISEQYEQIVFFRKGQARQNKFRGNIFRYNRVPGRPEHPHQKPESLLGDLITLCSQGNEFIVDPFMGTSSIGVVCSRIGRSYLGCEIDVDYYQIATRKVGTEEAQFKFLFE